MKKYLLALLAVVAVVLSAAAQEPVKWRTAVRMTSPTEGTVTVRAIIPEGAHLYGLTMPQGGPKATSLDFSASRGIALKGKRSGSPRPAMGDGPRGFHAAFHPHRCQGRPREHQNHIHDLQRRQLHASAHGKRLRTCPPV